MRYSEFRDKLLIAIYDEQVTAKGQFVSTENVLGPELTESSDWLHRFFDEAEERTYLQVNRSMGSLREWVIRMKPYGFEYVEEELKHQAMFGSFTSSIGVKDQVEAEIVRNDNTVVFLPATDPEHQDIKSKIAELAEELRGANDLQVALSEKERLRASLSAAQTLWDATELKVVQIRIGIILAIEDAARALNKLGKGVGSALLVDAIKGLVKQKTGIDL